MASSGVVFALPGKLSRVILASVEAKEDEEEEVIRACASVVASSHASVIIHLDLVYEYSLTH